MDGEARNVGSVGFDGDGDGGGEGCGSSRLSPGELGDFIGYRLRLSQIAAYRAFESKLDSRYGIAPRYLGLLALIRCNPGQPQSRLAEAIALSRSTLVPIIDRLAADGLVERRPSLVDRRYKSVWLTAHGLRTVEDLTAKAKAQEDKLSDGFTAEEREALLRLLAKVLDNLQSK